MDHRGHLVDMARASLDDFKKMLEDGYEPIPEHLKTQAKLELMGKKETFVSMTASGSMSKHARYLCKKKQQKDKAFRRKNRCYSE